MFTQRGMSMGMVIGIVVVILLLGGGWYLTQKSEPSETAKSGEMMEAKTDESMMEGGHDGDSMMENSDSMMETGASMEMEADAMKKETSFSGAVIAGSSSPLLEFNQRDYTAARASGRVVVLYFYANWCPLCKAEFVDTKAAFNALKDDSVVGFRVHFNDNDITPEMEALAREFGVAYQHTKVFLKNGERVLKSPETWSKERYMQEITKYTN